MPMLIRRRDETPVPVSTQNELSEADTNALASEQEFEEWSQDGGEPLPPVVQFRGGWVYADDPEYLASIGQTEYVPEFGEAPAPQQTDAVDQEAIKLQKRVEFLRSCTPGVLAQVYVDKRNERNEAKRVVADLQAKMDIIAQVIFEKMDELGLTEFRPDSDTRTSVTDGEIESATVTDREAYMAFIEQQLLTGTDPDALDYLENRASITTLREYMESNDGELPPGVKLNRVRKLRVTVTQGKRK